MKLSSKWVVAELCSLIFVENMKKQRQEVRNSAELNWWIGMDEKVAVIKIWSWNPQFLLELKNSFFLGSKNDKTMLTRKQITLRRNEMARQTNEDHWHFFFFAYVIRYRQCLFTWTISIRHNPPDSRTKSCGAQISPGEHFASSRCYVPLHQKLI